MQALTNMLKRLNLFEKILLLVGIAVTVAGFHTINKLYTGEGHLSWALLQTAFLWLLLLFMIILTDSNESIKEELKEVINSHIEETRILKRISNEQLAQLKLIHASLLEQRKQGAKKKPKRK